METYQFTSDGRKIIPLPYKFSVWKEDTREDAIKVLNAIDISAQKYRQKLLIDMSELVDFHAHSAILLFAHITSAQLISGAHDFVKIKLPNNIKTKSLIRKSGLWDVIKYGTKRKLDKNWDTNNNFQSGYDGEKHLDMTLTKLELKYGELPNKLDISINEAILNISQHAYKVNPKNSLKRWWQYIYIKDNKLNFLIYDKGLGIPSSFRLAGMYKNEHDHEIIKSAMEKGITSTKLRGRGNGSVNIQKPIAFSDCDILMIMSEKGVYKYVTKDDIESSKMGIKLPGTLMSWQIEVSKYEDN